MAKKPNLIATERDLALITISFPAKRPLIKSFVWREITEIKVLSVKTGLFGKSDDKIEIYTTHPETPDYMIPIEFFRSKEAEFFDEYVESLNHCAKVNSKKFTDLRK